MNSQRPEWSDLAVGVSCHIGLTRRVRCRTGCHTAIWREAPGNNNSDSSPIELELDEQRLAAAVRSKTPGTGSSSKPHRFIDPSTEGALDAESTCCAGCGNRRRAVCPENTDPRYAVTSALHVLHPCPEAVRHACAPARLAAATLGFLVCSLIGGDRDLAKQKGRPLPGWRPYAFHTVGFLSDVRMNRQIRLDARLGAEYRTS